MPTKDAVIDSDAQYLHAKHRKACWQFEKRPHEAQLAEAIVFRVLQKCSAKPDLADQSGGPDFICANGQFMVEATAFTIDKVTSDSFLPNEISDDVRVHAYQPSYRAETFRQSRSILADTGFALQESAL